MSGFPTPNPKTRAHQTHRFPPSTPDPIPSPASRGRLGRNRNKRSPSLTQHPLIWVELQNYWITGYTEGTKWLHQLELCKFRIWWPKFLQVMLPTSFNNLLFIQNLLRRIYMIAQFFFFSFFVLDHVFSPWNRKRGLSKARFDDRIVGHSWRVQENKQTAFSTWILCLWRDDTNCRCVLSVCEALCGVQPLRTALLTTPNPPKRAQPWEGLLGMQTRGCLCCHQQSFSGWLHRISSGWFLRKINMSYLLLWKADYSRTSRVNRFWGVVSDTGGGWSWEKPVWASIPLSHICLHSRGAPHPIPTDMPASKVSAWWHGWRWCQAILDGGKKWPFSRTLIQTFLSPPISCTKAGCDPLTVTNSLICQFFFFVSKNLFFSYIYIYF